MIVLAQPVDIIRPFSNNACIGAPKVVAINRVPIKARAVDVLFAHLDHVAFDLDVWRQRFDCRAGHTAGRHPRRSFARRRPTTAAIIAQPVFLVIRDVGMSGAEGVGDVTVVF